MRIAIDDISEPFPDHTLPDEAHVRTLIEFLRGWRADCRSAGPILIHCLAGVSRSMAGALIALVLGAEGREEEKAWQLRQAAPHASPNRRIVLLADQLLGRQGRLIKAREAMGPAEPLLSGPLVRVSLDG